MKTVNVNEWKGIEGAAHLDFNSAVVYKFTQPPLMSFENSFIQNHGRMADKDPAELGMSFARRLGGPKGKGAGEVLEFLQSKSAEEICAASTFLRDLGRYSIQF